jgi:hypothetical protein
MAAANSFGVMSSILRPAHSSGRSMGVFASCLVVKTPEMSGSPQGVFGGVNPLVIREAMNALMLSVPGTALTRAWIDPVCPVSDADPITAAAATASSDKETRIFI